MNTATKSFFDIFADSNLTPPSSKDEDWIYYNFDELNRFELLDNETKETAIETNKFFIYFINNELVKYNLPENTDFSKGSLPLKESKNAFIQLIKKNEYKLTINNCNETIDIIYDCDNNNKSYINLILNSSNITLNRVFNNKNNGIQINGLNTIINKDSSLLIQERNIDNNGFTLDFVDTELFENAVFKSLNESYSSTNSRFQNRVFVNGIKSYAKLHGLAINEEDRKSFYNTHVYHKVEDTESHQLFKSLNKENATFEYNGKVSVEKDAQQINSYQLNQNILLDEYANVYSRPQLFIDADDVKCTHGSTTGDINQDQLFYLKSRGLNDNQSKRVILRGFIEDVISISNDTDINTINKILNKVV